MREAATAEAGAEVLSCLQAALGYAARGWPVLALHSVRDGGRCTCNRECGSPGKHPIKTLTPHGFKDATTDATTIRAWWERCLWANVGIVVGIEVADGKRLGVVDLDRHGDVDGVDLAAEVYGYDPKAAGACARTGSGGLHGFMLLPADMPLKSRTGDDAPAPGVEIKVSGYVVAQPSLHASGSRYEWLVDPADEPIPDAPQWVIEALRAADEGADEVGG
ncbi:bifunctional DNA primase/polymerase, partial [Planctomycetota bacterium]